MYLDDGQDMYIYLPMYLDDCLREKNFKTEICKIVKLSCRSLGDYQGWCQSCCPCIYSLNYDIILFIH